MVTIGITGGIGSGKSTVTKQLVEAFKHDIPVFNTDNIAGECIHDKSIVNLVTEIFGPESYIDGKANKAHIGAIVFSNEMKRKALEALIGPLLMKKYAIFCELNKNEDFVLVESAIFYETNTQDMVDFMIGVFASEETRLARVMRRNNLTKEEVLARMACQMKEEDKLVLCDYAILNEVTFVTPTYVEKAVEVINKLVSIYNKGRDRHIAGHCQNEKCSWRVNAEEHN